MLIAQALGVMTDGAEMARVRQARDVVMMAAAEVGQPMATDDGSSEGNNGEADKS